VIIGGGALLVLGGGGFWLRGKASRPTAEVPSRPAARV
jgi:hypothetical protein